jgi:hypothetical protein
MAAGVVSIRVCDVAQRVSDEALIARGLITPPRYYGEQVALMEASRKSTARRKRDALACSRRNADQSREEDVRTLLSDVADYLRGR